MVINDISYKGQAKEEVDEVEKRWWRASAKLRKNLPHSAAGIKTESSESESDELLIMLEANLQQQQ